MIVFRDTRNFMFNLLPNEGNGSCCTLKAKDAFVRQLNDRQHEDVNAFVQEKKAEMKARQEVREVVIE